MSDAPALHATDPVIAPHLGAAELTDQIAAITLRQRAFRWWWFAMLPATALVGVLTIAILWLFYAGIGIWGIDWPVVWGFAIINYVWWIAIASGGTFISAMFFLLDVDWRKSLNRIAESMTLFAAACAGIYPILHLGRPWFFYWLFPYPDTMHLWPQFRSPLLWDFFAILTYVIASILFWYLGLIPDLATMRDRAPTRRKQMLYGAFASGFRGSAAQWRHFRAAYAVLAAIMAPLVCSVHSIVGLDFAGAGTVGWHSTQFPPFFVFGAVFSGFAVVLLWVIPLRRLLHLENVITGRHIDVLGRILLTSSLCVGYAYAMDVFTTFYGPDKAEHTMFMGRINGIYAPVYWGTILCNVLVPQLLWLRSIRLNQTVMMLISLDVVIGMWMERYLIVVSSLHRPNLPSSWGLFHGTFWDWATLLGTVGFFIAGMLIAVRFIPMVSLYELRELDGAARMILLASFASDEQLQAALQRARNAGIGAAEIYVPCPPDVPSRSPLPLIILAAGLLGALAGFLMQVYANTVSYPMDIGGRPNFSWPSFVPIAFEIGVLCAVAAGFFGFLIINRLPHLYDPVDEAELMRDAMRARWLLVLRPTNEAATMQARALIRELPLLDYEEPGGVNNRARLLLCGLLLLVSCDDMTSQPKWLDYSPAAGPVAPPPGVVDFQQAAAPPPLDAALMQRGQQEFRIYCTPCHAESGDGNGMIVQRGFPHPPSLLSPPLRQASTQLFFDTITNGHGAMYSYAARVAPRDRWAIAAYVRALQFADSAPVADVPDAERGALR